MAELKKRKRTRCIVCGDFLCGKSSKYCKPCSAVMEKKQDKIRQERYRLKHKDEIKRKGDEYKTKNKDTVRLTARNYYLRNKELCKQRLREWRKNNPEKIKEQHKREWLNSRKRIKKSRRLEYRNRFLIKSLCVDCNKEFKYIRKIKTCPECFMKKQKEQNNRQTRNWSSKNPDAFKIWYQNNHEVIVGKICIACGEFVIYKHKGRIPQVCDICRAKRRSRPKPVWEPKDTKTFISVERFRLKLDKHEVWTPYKIDILFNKWEERQPRQLLLDDDDNEESGYDIINIKK